MAGEGEGGDLKGKIYIYIFFLVLMLFEKRRRMNRGHTLKIKKRWTVNLVFCYGWF